MRTKTTWGKGNGYGHGFGRGPGWGGPARGASRSRKAAPFAPGNRAAIGHNGPDWERLAAERERTERILDALFALAMGVQSEVKQVAAAVAFLTRVEGPCRTMVEVAAQESPSAKPGGITVRFVDE